MNNSGWWGEGEVKFFLDGDDEFDDLRDGHRGLRFCGSAWRFDVGGRYTEFTTPYAGMPQVLRPTARTGRSSASGCTAGT